MEDLERAGLASDSWYGAVRPEDEDIDIVLEAAESFDISHKSLESLEHLAVNSSAGSLFVILCCIVAKDGEAEDMPRELGEWFARSGSIPVKTLPLRISDFKLPAFYFELLRNDVNPIVRSLLAEHPCIPAGILRALRADLDPSVRAAALRNSCQPIARQ